jgi:hypothetical protein
MDHTDFINTSGDDFGGSPGAWDRSKSIGSDNMQVDFTTTYNQIKSKFNKSQHYMK